MRNCHEVHSAPSGDLVIDREFRCPHSEAEIRREYLAGEGRRLASQREDLIAQGVDPGELDIPIHPDDEDQQGEA